MVSASDLRIVHYAPGAAMPLHRHEQPSFSAVTAGDFVERSGVGECHYAKGYVTFSPAGIEHSQRFGGQGAQQIIFTPEPCWLDYLADCRLRLEDAAYVRSALLERLAERLLSELRQRDAFSAMACEGIVLEIVAAFGRDGAPANAACEPPAWLKAARDFMHANADRSIGLKQIAQAAGRHEIHLAREFRRYFGMPAAAYLRQLRVENAAGLLSETRGEITEIALACGFASHSHLCRVFKAHFGVTPSQYRARH